MPMRLGQRLELMGLVVSLLIPVIAVSQASAHEMSTTAGGSPFPLLMGVSAVVGLLGGVIVLPSQSDRFETIADSAYLPMAVGILLFVLALTFVWSAVPTHPVLSFVGATTGMTVAALLPLHSHSQAVIATSTVAAVLLHRIVESISLAELYATGAAVGTFSLAVLTIHAVAECAAVAGSYAAAGEVRQGLLALGFVQGTYLIVGIGVWRTTFRLGATAETLSVAGAGGLLLMFGLHEMRHSWELLT